MQLVQIPYSGVGVVQYPDSRANFRGMQYVESLRAAVGEYYGEMDLTPYVGPWPVPSGPTEYQLAPVAITVNGSPATYALNGDPVASIGDTVELSTALVGGESVTYPGAVLKLPVTRHADGQPTADEIYFSATIVGGTITATGTFASSGDWKMLPDRINKALERAGADWKLDASPVTVLV